MTRRSFRALRLLPSSPVETSSRPYSAHITYRVFIHLALILNVIFLSFVIYTRLDSWLSDGFFPAVRRLRQTFRYGSNAFDPVHVRLTHPQVRRSSGGFSSGSQASQAGGRRRVIHGVQEQTYEEYDRTRKRSFQPNLERFLNVPFWKKRSLGSLQISQETPVSVTEASTDEVVGQVGDALKGNAPDDLIFSPTRPSQLFRRVLRKTSMCHWGDSDDGIEPPLTALLADPDPEEDKKRKVAITSGVVALGLAQAGSALASSVGGGIGPEILVRCESSDRIDKLTPMPSMSQDIVATGVDR
jgi:hypothetical protein